ncbi:Plant protein of unknown function D [Prunus dulcis]|uniref:Trichome birefringence-like C-terminal domain-containing protein n=1 Tax=Prunus dulcis TaxID=3755 RepID=A0A4Y1RZ34_PRUDU|nr:Plant protein of unknown function D [Prunus dulcis]
MLQWGIIGQCYSPDMSGVLISSQKRLLSLFIVRANQSYLPLTYWMDLKLFLRIWSLTYKTNFLKRHSSYGGYNHQGISMGVSGIENGSCLFNKPLKSSRADAHPAIWLGQKDAVAIWGQDCMHWCLPGVPDTWVDILNRADPYWIGDRMMNTW